MPVGRSVIFKIAAASNLERTDPDLLKFLWCSMERKEPPEVYEWQVLPFGTTSSLCCAIYTVQRHVQDHNEQNRDVMETVNQSFYVDNYLRSLSCPEEARQLLLTAPERVFATIRGRQDLTYKSCSVMFY